MAVAYAAISNTTYASRTNTTVAAAGLGTITNGDTLYFLQFTGGVAEVTATAPSGFNIVSGGTWPIAMGDGSFHGLVYLWYKQASGESGDYTATHASASSQGVMVRVSGGDGGVPVATTNFGTNPTSPADSTALGITTANNGALVLVFATDWADTTNNLAGPAGTTPTFTERLDTTLSGCWTGNLATAGATGDKTFANNSASGGASPWSAIMTVVEPAAGASANAPSVNDAVTASESVTLSMPLKNTAVNDAVTLTESVTVALNRLVVSVFDDVTVLDVANDLSNDLYPVVFDSVLVQDSPAIQPAVLSVGVEVFDNVIVNEGPTDNNSISPSVFEAITLTESVGITLTLLRVTVFDVVTVIDAPGIFAQGPLGVVTFDSVTVQEFLARYMSLYINAFDNVSVIDGAWAPEVFDAVTLTEDITVKLGRLVISVSDSVALEESLELFGTALNLTTFEELPIDESSTVLLRQLTPSSYDDVTLAESVTVSISTINLSIDVFDALTVTESIENQTNPIQIDEFTEILAVDVSTILTSTLYIDSSETVTVSESIDMRVRPILFNVSEDVTVNERVVLRLSKGGKRRTGLLTMGAGE